MKMNKQMILDKTHSGLTIYAHILRQFYPNEQVLKLCGRVCAPTKNPYKAHKQTLVIEEKLVDQKPVFCFRDMEDPNFNGDVFQFVTLYTNLNESGVLQYIIDQLHLNKPLKFYNDGLPDVEVVNAGLQTTLPTPKFSYFRAPVTNTSPLKEVSISDVHFLIKNQFHEQTSQLRSINDKKEARKYKAQYFDYVCFSGLFKKRTDTALIKHSDLLAIDFDHVADVSTLKHLLIEDDLFNTEIIFTSPSGDGLKWVIGIDTTQFTHQQWFQAVQNYIEHTYKVKVDNAGKDISRACFLPHDPDIFIHPKYLSK